MTEALGIDLNETTPVELYGVSWTVGLIPWGIYGPLKMEGVSADSMISDAIEGMDADEIAAWFRSPAAVEIVGSPEYQVAMVPIEQKLVRHGLKAWRMADGAEVDEDGKRKLPPVSLETVTLDGRSHTVVPWDVVEFFSHVEDGALLSRLATAVRAANSVSAKRLTGFR